MDLVNIRPATLEDIEYIAANVRDADRAELWAATMETPYNAMKNGLTYSEQTMVGCYDGRPVVVWGVVSESFITSVGIPWMVATKELDKLVPVFLRRCKLHLLEMVRDYDMLINHVDARNTRAIRWLKWMGFEVDTEAKPYGLLELPFYRFTKRRRLCAAQQHQLSQALA